MRWMSQLMGSSEDAVKNFYTLAYHIKHSASFWWFDGMNYPFGEHVMFTDNQPLLAAILKALEYVFPVADNLTFLLSLILLLSFMGGAYALFKIIQSAGGPDWFSILSSVGIIFLSPQWLRIKGHYSLAHGVVIPLMLFAAYKFYTTKSKWWLVIIPLLAGFIHPYFMVMLALFVGFYLVLMMIHNLEIFKIKSWVIAITLTLLPLIIFQVFMWVTDPVADRPEAPYGYLIYRATLPSVFLPLDLPHGAECNRMVEDVYPPSLEGNYYVGLFAIISVMGGVVAWFFSRKMRFDSTVAFAFSAFLASIPILLLGLGFPFAIEHFDRFLEYTGPLQQFRGIGRFTFVFYYAMNLFGAVTIAHYLKTSGKIALFVAILGLTVLYTEGAYFSRNINQHNESVEVAFSQITGFQSEFADFSAILPLPFYHTGSENFRTLQFTPNLSASMALSYSSGLPLLSVQMSRTSLSQSLQTLALVGERLNASTIVEQHKNEHWLLMVDPKAELPSHQKQLVLAARFLRDHDGFQLYYIEAKTLNELVEVNKARAKESLGSSLNLLGSDSLRLSHHVFYASFDHEQTTNIEAFDGAGAKQFDRKEWFSILPIGIVFDSIQSYELSFWVYAADQHAVNTQIWFWERAAGQELSFRATEIGDHVTAISGNWALVRYSFTSQSKQSEFEVLLHRDGASMNVLIDEVLLRPSHLTVHKPGRLNINNSYFQPNAPSVVN